MIKILHFYADWSNECDVQNNILEELAEEYDDVTFELVNVDYQEAKSKKYQIVSIPTLVFEIDKEFYTKIEGLVDLEELEDLIDDIYEGDMDEEDFWEPERPF